MPANKDEKALRQRVERDKEIIRLYVKGLTYQEIGGRLGVSRQSIFNRVQYLRGKGVNLPDRNDAAKRLVEELNHFCSMI